MRKGNTQVEEEMPRYMKATRGKSKKRGEDKKTEGEIIKSVIGEGMRKEKGEKLNKLDEERESERGGKKEGESR